MSAKDIISRADTKALDALLSAHKVSDLKAIIAAATDAGLNASLLPNAKNVLLHITEGAGDDEDWDFGKEVCTAVLESIGKSFTTYGAEALRCREVLADFYEGEEKLLKALEILMSIPTESALGIRSSADEYKGALWIRIARLSIDVENETQAEIYTNRAWPVMKNIKDKDTKLQFETVFAQVADANRKFLDAGNRYFQLCHKLDEPVAALQKAIVCCVLTPAGPKRARLIGLMIRDESVQHVGDLFGILTKLYLERILREKDIKSIEPYLKDHHKARRADGRTFFENAVHQHNLLSASKLYTNIHLTELGNLLGVHAQVAEKIAATMIAEDRLKATIDQEKQFIEFLSDPSAPVLLWDSQIASVCHSLTRVADEVAQKYPKLGAALADP